MDISKVDRKDFVSGIILACCGLYITFGKNVISGKTFGVDSMPLVARASFYIRTLGIALLVLSVVLIVRSLRHPSTAEKKTIPLVAVIGAITLICFNLVLNIVGFFAAATMLITIWTFMFRLKEYHIDRKDKKGLLRSGIISIVFALISVAVLQTAFTHLLGVRLP